MSARVRVAHLAELERIRVDDELWFRPLRRPLGITAFGMNAFTADEPGERVVEEHTEGGEGARGHEEAYIVVTGRATFTVGDEQIDAPAGTVVFLPDPEVKRGAIATEPNTTVIAVGGEPGTAMPPSVWEHWFFADPHSRAGDHEKAIEIASAGLADWPDHPSLHYQLACYHAQAGHEAEALEHLAKAVEGNPRCAHWAAGDSDLDPIRANPAFPR